MDKIKKGQRFRVTKIDFFQTDIQVGEIVLALEDSNDDWRGFPGLADFRVEGREEDTYRTQWYFQDIHIGNGLELINEEE